MRIHKMFINTMCVVFMLGLLQACSWTGNSSIASSNSTTNFKDENGLDELQVDFIPDMNSNTLKIKRLRLTDGQLVLRLFSPDGKVQWEKELSAPAIYRQAFNLETTLGIWKLEIELLNATGTYDISWKASN